MFLLPESTIIDRVIPESTLFSRAVRGDVLKSSFREQIQRVYWRHKLSADSYGLKASGYFKELEIFEILLTERSLDKRILRAMDKAIPYYLLHVLSSQGRYQALIAEKSARNGKIRIDNYVRSCWMEEDQLQFLFEERDLDKLNTSLKQQIDEKRGKL